MKRIVLITILFFSSLAQAAVYTPEEVPDPKEQSQNYYVSDPDGLLADSTVTWLNNCAARLEQETEVEMCITALESIGDADAFDFAYELFQRWGIGKKGKNTGVLILFALESHDLQILTGTGIEGVLTDAKCSQIMHDEMFPAFQAEDYDGGLCRGALAIYEVCTDGDAPEELLTIRSVTNRGKYAPEEEDTWGIMENIVLWLLLGFTAFSVLMTYLKMVKRCPVCHKRKAYATGRRTLIAATYNHAGEEEVTYRCKACGNEFKRKHVLPKLVHSTTTFSSGGGGGGWSSSGGGGGSWGGGSTSGGGAGGKW